MSQEMKKKIFFNSFGFAINSQTGTIYEGDIRECEIVDQSEMESKKADWVQIDNDKESDANYHSMQIDTTDINMKEEDNIVQKTQKSNELNYSSQSNIMKGDTNSLNTALIEKKSLVKPLIINDIKSNFVFENKDFNKEIQSKSIKEEEQYNNNDNNNKNKNKDISDSVKIITEIKEKKKLKLKQIKPLSLSKEMDNINVISQQKEPFIININHIKETLASSIIQSNPKTINFLTSIYNRADQLSKNPLNYLNYEMMQKSLAQCTKNELLTGLFFFMYLNQYILSLVEGNNNKIQIKNDTWDISNLNQNTSEPSSSTKPLLTQAEINLLLKENKLYSNFLFVLSKYYQSKNDLLLKAILQKEGIVFDPNTENFSQELYRTDYFIIVINYSAKNGFSHRVDYLNIK